MKKRNASPYTCVNPPQAHLNGDCVVNQDDISILLEQRMDCGLELIVPVLSKNTVAPIDIEKGLQAEHSQPKGLFRPPSTACVSIL